jgi:hypothetical protein
MFSYAYAMGKTWEAFRQDVPGAIKEAHDRWEEDKECGIDFGFWAWDFIQRHGCWIGFWTGFALLLLDFPLGCLYTGLCFVFSGLGNSSTFHTFFWRISMISPPERA